MTDEQEKKLANLLRICEEAYKDELTPFHDWVLCRKDLFDYVKTLLKESKDVQTKN